MLSIHSYDGEKISSSHSIVCTGSYSVVIVVSYSSREPCVYVFLLFRLLYIYLTE